MQVHFQPPVASKLPVTGNKTIVGELSSIGKNLITAS
jgi:hypothetical protein